MTSKRLNIMLYSSSTGEQIILPVNPENIEIRHSKTFETFKVLGYGEINLMGQREPLKIKLMHFLPEDDSIFASDSMLAYDNSDGLGYTEDSYVQGKVVAILRNWAREKSRIRLIIDDEINIECMVSAFNETLRENTVSRPYTLEVIEYRNPAVKTSGTNGLLKRTSAITVPKTILMKSKDTIYSIASKYNLDYKVLASNNGIEDVNAECAGQKISTAGA